MKQLLAILTVISLFAVASSTTSCQKTGTTHDSTTVIVRDTLYQTLKNPIVGLWVGKYLNNGDVDSFYYSFDIQANGNCISTAIGATNNSDATSGPWHLSGTAFTATLTQLTNATPLIQAITATYDSTAGTLTGQWMYTQGTGVNGTFTLTRVP